MSPSGPSAVVEPSGIGGIFLGATAGVSGVKVAGQGTVASVKGSCPTLTMVVRGVRVTTTASTTYPGGLACGNLRPGTKVDVDGETDEDGSVTASSITILDQPGGPPPDNFVEGDGTVGSRKGTCPNLTLVVHGYPVMTTTATSFPDGCDAVQSGARIHVQGTIVGNSVLASLVDVLEAP